MLAPIFVDPSAPVPQISVATHVFIPHSDLPDETLVVSSEEINSLRRRYLFEQICEFLLGEKAKDGTPDLCIALEDLGYGISNTEWQGLLDGTLDGIPDAAAVIESIERDLWHAMYAERDLNTRSKKVLILQNLRISELIREGEGIKKVIENSPVGLDTLFTARFESELNVPNIEQRIVEESKSMKEAGFSSAELLLLKQMELRKLGTLVGLVSSNDEPQKLFKGLASKVSNTTPSFWENIFFDREGYSTISYEMRAAIERAVLTSLCERVVNPGELAAEELGKIQWAFLNVGSQGEHKPTNVPVRDSMNPVQGEMASSPSKPNVVSTSTSESYQPSVLDGERAVHSAQAALAHKLEQVRRGRIDTPEKRESNGLSGGIGEGTRSTRSTVRYKNVFEAILKVGHDEDFEGISDEDFLPTDAPAGSPEKIEVIKWRLENGYPLWHVNDRVDYAGLTGVIRPQEVDEEGNETDSLSALHRLSLADTLAEEAA